MSNLKTIPTLLSDDELIQAFSESVMGSEEVTEVLDSSDDIVPFLSHYNVVPGDMLVSKKLLYKLYKTYSKEPQTERTFNNTVGTFLGHYRNYSGNFYLINQDAFKISQYIFKDTLKHKVKKTHSGTYQRHFEWFTSNACVESGNNWLEGFILHQIYKDHCRSKHVTATLGTENFHKFLKLHFEHRRVSKSRALFFKVDDNTFNKLTEEEKNGIREGRKKGRSKKDSKEKSKEA